MGKFDHLFRYKGGRFCQEYYPTAFVAYSRGLRELTDKISKDPLFVGTHDQLVKHIVYMSKSNRISISDDGKACVFGITGGQQEHFRHNLRAEFVHNEASELELVMLMLESETGEL